MEEMTGDELLDAIERGMRVVVERFRAQNEAEERAEQALQNAVAVEPAGEKQPDLMTVAG
jgi:hypothetical protein